MSKTRKEETPLFNKYEYEEKNTTQQRDINKNLAPIINNAVQFVPLTEQTIIVNTETQGLHILDISNEKNIVQSRCIDQPRETLDSLQIAKLSRHVFIRLCYSPQKGYLLQVWDTDKNKMGKNKIAEVTKTVSLPQIPPKVDEDSLQNPQILSVNPIRIIFRVKRTQENKHENKQKKTVDHSGLELIKNYISESPAVLTIRKDAKEDKDTTKENEDITYEKFPQYLSMNPLKIWPHGKFSVLCNNLEDQSITIIILNKKGEIQKEYENKKYQFYEPERYDWHINMLSPDERFLAIADLKKNQLKIRKITHHHDLIKLEKIPIEMNDNKIQCEWLADGSLVYFSKTGVALFNPNTLEHATLFTKEKDEKNELRNLIVTPKRNKIMFFLGDKMISLEIPHLKNLLAEKLTRFFSPDIAKYTASFDPLSSVLYKKFKAPTSLPEDQQKKMELQHAKLEVKIAKLKKESKGKENPRLHEAEQQLKALEELALKLKAEQKHTASPKR